MCKKLGLIIILAALMVSCGQSREKQLSARMQGLTEMAELGTVEYTVKKVVTADSDAWYKIGKRRILFTCTSFIKAGIKMKDLPADAVSTQEEQNSITVTLPKAEILSFNMPPEEIKEVYNISTGLRDKFTPEEKQFLLSLGEKDIESDIPNMGILEDAEANAKLFFTALLSQLGYERITINFK